MNTFSELCEAANLVCDRYRLGCEVRLAEVIQFPDVHCEAGSTENKQTLTTFEA